MRKLQLSANDLQGSLASLLTELVRIPSRAGVDTYDEIFGCIARWLDTQNVTCTVVRGENGRPSAIAGCVGPASQGGAIVLNACVDTAGFGDLATWKHAPTGAEIEANFLYGRGSADSKAGVAVFCHLLAAFRRRDLARQLAFVFDADEHNGCFGGIRAWLDGFKERVDGVLIGYPGQDRIGVGARGFWRTTLHISGKAAHSGSSRDRGVNAISKATRLIDWLEEAQIDMARDSSEAFPLPPKFTVTGIRAGGEFSLVPDSCELDVDVRLTPVFTAPAAEAKIDSLLALLDAQRPSPTGSCILKRQSVPAYSLPAESPLAMALARAAERILAQSITLAVTGPSNVGNWLAERGIPATCGFGVSYRNMHGAEECVDLTSLLPTYLVYEAALDELLEKSY
jgi:succinyl-diaminopimelate desuccinylase